MPRLDVNRAVNRRDWFENQLACFRFIENMAIVVWEKWRFNLPFCLNIITLFLTQNCQAATHWIVTENGRIEAQSNSLFNLQKPFDLVTFIHQEQKLNKVNNLRKELRKEQDILDEVNQQERIDLSETFFKTDPTCSKEKRWYDLDIPLNYIIPFSSKNINVAHHIDLESAVKTHSVKTPLCLQNIPITLYSFDHLEGVANRHTLPGVSEQALLKSMKYVTDVDDWGDRIARALTKNSTSWVLQNMAALYWRIKGNTVQSINCLREALFYSPREHRDIALVSLAIVLHRVNYSLDAVMLLHVSLENTRDVALHQYILGHIYATLELYNMTELCLKYVTLVQPAFQPANKRLKVATCERRYMEALQEQYSSLQRVLSRVEKHKDIKETLKKLQDRDHIKQDFAYDVFKQQLERLSREPVAWSESPLGSYQEIIQEVQGKAQEMTSIQKDIVSAIGNNNIDNGEAFTVNIQLDEAGPFAQKKVHCQKANSNGKTTQVPCKMFEVEGKQGQTTTKFQIDGKQKTDNLEKVTEERFEQKGHGKVGVKQEKEERIRTTNNQINNNKNNGKTIGDKKEREKIVKTTQTTSAKSSKTKKKHETEKRTTKSASQLEDESLTLHERTVRQMGHARETIARVKSMLNIPHVSKNTVGPEGVGHEQKRKEFSKENLKSTKKGETMRSTDEEPLFEKRQSPHVEHLESNIYHWENEGQQEQFCDSPSTGKKQKGDNFRRGCQHLTNNDPDKKNVQAENTDAKKQKYSNIGCDRDASQATRSEKTATKSPAGTGDKRDRCSSQATEDGSKASSSERREGPGDKSTGDSKNNSRKEKKIERENSGKESVLSSLKEFQEALKKSKNQQPSHDFDYRSCNDIENPMEALSHKSTMFSTVVSVVSKGVDVSKFVNFNEDISGLPKPPRCLAEIRPGSKSLDHIKGVLLVGKNVGEKESSLKQTLLSHAHLVGKDMDVEEIGTRIHRALKKSPTAYVVLNLASLYWRIMGNIYEAVRCLRLAVQHAPTRSSLDIPLISLASILFRGGFLEDAATLNREALEISPNAAIGHFALANTLAAQGAITEATQHFLIVLQLEPGFVPAIERLKVIQCILWEHQKQLEKEADELRKLLAAS